MSLKNKLPLLLLLTALCLTGCAQQEEELTTETNAPAATVEKAAAPELPNIIISEFMEKNRATIADEDGDFPDWIELYNADSHAVNLKDWRLSDEPDKKGWKFPDVSIEPGEHLLVFASNKEKEVGDVLHADFAISGDEGVYLKSPEGAIVSQALCGNCAGDLSMVNNLLSTRP